MKRLVVAVAVLLAIIAAGAVEAVYVDKVFDTYSPDMRAFSVALAETEGSLECGDDKNALSKCQSLLTMAGNIHDMLDFNLQDIV